MNNEEKSCRSSFLQVIEQYRDAIEKNPEMKKITIKYLKEELDYTIEQINNIEMDMATKKKKLSTLEKRLAAKEVHE